MKTNQMLQTERSGDVLTVRLGGEIDHHRAAHLRCEIDDCIRAERPSILRLDAAGVSFMDSSGLGLIMGRYALVERLGGKLVLCDPSPTVERMVRLAGMERIVKIEKKAK